MKSSASKVSLRFPALRSSGTTSIGVGPSGMSGECRCELRRLVGKANGAE
jgi:hypothetical protein